MVMHRWEDPVVREFMIDSKYGFADCKPISLESAKLEKEWEHRRAFSVELYTTRIYEEVVDNITGAAVTGKYLTVASAIPPRKYVGKPLDVNGIAPVDPTPIQPMLNKFSNVITGRERDYDFDSIPDKRLGWSFQDLWHNNWKWNDY